MRSFVSFLSGVAVGSVLGVLFAPDSGKNTRDRLSYRLDKYLGQLKAALDEKTEAPEGPGAATPSSTDLSRADRRRAEELLREVESMLDDLKANPGV